MPARSFDPVVFQISKLPYLGITASLLEGDTMLTFNQLARESRLVGAIFIFDENDPDTPPLAVFSRHFRVPIFKLDARDIAEVRGRFVQAHLLSLKASSESYNSVMCMLKDIDMAGVVTSVSNLSI